MTLKKSFRLIFKISLVAIFGMASCSKDQSIQGPFILGSPNPYVTIEYPDTTQGKNQWSFDLDNDGKTDISFGVSFESSLGGVRVVTSGVRVQGFYYAIGAIESKDTLYACNKYEGDTLVHTVFHNNGSNYVCPNSINYKDSLYSISTYNYPKPFSKGEPITNPVIWDNGDLTLFYNNTTHIVYSPKSYSILRGSWLDEEKHYLVFRNKEFDNGYGWICFKLEGGIKMYVYEIARPKP